jgi:hypothetical protein
MTLDVGADLKLIRRANLKVTTPNTPISHSQPQKLVKPGGHYRIGPSPEN